MNIETGKALRRRYIPVVTHFERETALDALLALDVPREEAMDLMVAAWLQPGGAILAHIDGGRAVAAVPLPNGRWAAGNAFPDYAGRSEAEALRYLARVAKRGRKGLVACIFI